MNDPAHNPIAQGEAEETLRLIAHLPVPQGLEDRVRAALHSRPRQGRILSWPSVPRLESNWMRSAAAAAIVFVVAGGGWGIYSRVQPPQAKVIVIPMHVARAGRLFQRRSHAHAEYPQWPGPGAARTGSCKTRLDA